MSQSVFVLYPDNQPAMPTQAAKARLLLKNKQAKLVKLHPYTIKLKFEPSDRIHQEVRIGLNPGSKHLGVSAVVCDEVGYPKEVVYAAEAKLRDDVVGAMETRKQLRRRRRSILRYRAPRWRNRGNMIREGRLANSAISKRDSHTRMVDFLTKYLPVTKCIVEMASFDTQKMLNPDIQGEEYQHGTLFGYMVKEYLLEKFNRTCVYCGAKNVQFDREHVIPKSRGGSSKIDNLVLACRDCNITKQTKTAEEFGHPEVLAKAQAHFSMKDMAHASAFKWQLWRYVENKFGRDNVEATFGSITKYKRSKANLNLPKSDANDAVAIAHSTQEAESHSHKARQISPTYEVWFRTRSSRSLAVSMPTKCHELSKKQLRNLIYDKSGLVSQKLIDKAVADGHLRLAPDSAKLPRPTKLEALRFYNDAPGYLIVRHRIVNSKGEFRTNPNQNRPLNDSTKGRMGKWRKGHIFVFNNRYCVVTGLDKNGQYRYRHLNSQLPNGRASVKHFKLIMRRAGVNHWPIDK